MANNYFHYTSGKGLFGILSTGTLQCTNINFLNDPTENKYLDNILEELFIIEPEFKKLHKCLYNPTLESSLYTYNYYVASFSKKQDSLYMWNYYGSGNGYNIEMDLDSIVSLNKKKFDGIFMEDVIYDKKKQMTKLVDLFIKYQQKYSDFLNKYDGANQYDDEFVGELMDIEFRFTDSLYGFKFLFKHIAYRHEEETRLIIAQDYTVSQANQNYKVSKSGVIIQYTTLKLDLKKCVKSITVHPAASELHLMGAHMIFNSKIGNVDISKIKKSKVPFRVV